MNFLETPTYKKWYASHRRFSFTVKYCIELYEEKNIIPQTIFFPFLKSLSCHSNAEEKMFAKMKFPSSVFEEHSTIILTKHYTDEEKYKLCKSLLNHMKEEESIVIASSSRD